MFANVEMISEKKYVSNDLSSEFYNWNILTIKSMCNCTKKNSSQNRSNSSPFQKKKKYV